MFTLHLFDNTEAEYPTFRAAFVAMYDAVKSQKSISMQLLETWTWIKPVSANTPLMFWAAVDKAREDGILGDDGKILP